MYPYEFKAPARQEFLLAVTYYEELDPVLGTGFQRAVERAIEKIRLHPQTWPRHVSRTRRMKVRNFPYGIVYHVVRDKVVIVAVMHLTRRPGYWKSRLKG